MDPEDGNELERIFHEALERKTHGERAAFLDGACGDDVQLRSRVEVLLTAHVEADEFLEDGIVHPEQAAVSEGAGSEIGNYKLLQRIGEGGMGVVYMAEQQKPVRRKVALKVIKLGMDTKQVIARFEAERQALAMMDHPSIARVLDAGATDTGRPYFVMELVRGVAIDEYCDTQKLATRERLELFIDVCHALQHAHQKGIIHRDIKPGNVLVTSHDGRPVPKIIDFGVAKATNQRLTEMTLFTEFHQFIGTPEYMSPEQAEMSGLDVDTRSDVYSLGVLLYNLLTGTTPVDARTLRDAGYENMQRLIREQEATAPSTLISKMGDASTDIAKHRSTEPGVLESIFRGDLDWIVMKSLEKDRTRRYETVAAMADDVQRHLDDQPVLAGRPSAAYKLNKFVRRNRVPVLAGTVAVTAILIGLGAAVTGLWQARAEARRSQMITDTLQDLLVSVDPGRAASFSVDVEDVLRRAREAFGDEHATVAATLNSLAVQLHNSGDFDGATPLYEESLRIWESIYGREHLNIALTLGRLGELHGSQGDAESAEGNLREALTILEALPEAPGLASCPIRLELAKVLNKRGERDAAAELFRQAIAIYEEDPGAHRYQLIQTREQYVVVLLDQPDKTAVLEVLGDIYDDVRATYDSGSVLHLTSAIGLANWLGQVGRPDEAEKYYREALGYLRAESCPQGVYRMVVLDRLFQILRRRTDPEGMAEADEILAECIDAFASSWTPRELVENINHLADRLRERELWVAALEPGARAAQVALDKNLGARTIDRLREKLAVDAMYVGMVADRENHDYERALEVIENLLIEQPGHGGYVVVLGGVLYRLGQAEAAHALYSELSMASDAQARDVAPAKAGFHALIEHSLGNSDAAGVYLSQLIESTRGRHGLAQGPTQALLAEVQDTLDRQN